MAEEVNQKELIDPLLGPKHCFVNDEGYMICNWVFRRGRIVRPVKARNLRFFVGLKRRNRAR